MADEQALIAEVRALVAAREDLYHRAVRAANHVKSIVNRICTNTDSVDEAKAELIREFTDNINKPLEG